MKQSISASVAALGSILLLAGCQTGKAPGAAQPGEPAVESVSCADGCEIVSDDGLVQLLSGKSVVFLKGIRFRFAPGRYGSSFSIDWNDGGKPVSGSWQVEGDRVRLSMWNNPRMGTVIMSFYRYDDGRILCIDRTKEPQTSTPCRIE